MRIKSIVIISIVVFINFILQTTLYRHIEILGVKPNTALLIIVSFAVLRGEISGCIIGFAAGLLWDLATGDILGYYALLGAITGWLCGKPFSGFYKENYVFPALLSLISSALWEIAYYTAHLSRAVSAATYFLKVALPEIAYTMVLSLPVFAVLYWINSGMERVKDKG